MTTPLELTMTLPPPPYARQGGEMIAAQLAKVGINAKIAERRVGAVAQRHLRQQGLRPDDHLARRAVRLRQLRQADYYWGYESKAFNDAVRQDQHHRRRHERNKLLGDAQKLLADEAVNAYLYQPTWITVGKKGVKGLWKDTPIFANDLSAWSWQ